MTFADGYVDVPTRLRMALDRFPDLRVQETGHSIQPGPDGTQVLVCTVTVWRDPSDPLPSIASASEPYPGKTPFTRNSELMVGFTSALGRALGYMGFGIDRSIASANEVEARTGQTAPTPAPAAPRGPWKPTEKQERFLRALGHTGPMPGTRDEFEARIVVLRERNKPTDSQEEPF
jgi:hypothetical protein